MAVESVSPPGEEEDDDQRDFIASAHHPSPPPDELFDISTTVDPGYIISLIRKLVPTDARSSDKMEKTEASLSADGVLKSLNHQSEAMDTVDDLDKFSHREVGENEDSCQKFEQPGASVGEEVWEDCGCILWDLAASQTHAELMVQNLLLEVLLANLVVSQSVRITEISLGIIGNLACHEVPMKHIVSTKGLVEIIVDQLFLDDAQCLCEACRLLTLGLQGSESITWAEALQSECFLSRILWVADNTLNPQLIEKSVRLLLAILESQQEVSCVLLPPLMQLGLPRLLTNLLAIEMSKLTHERIPERYSVLDVILRSAEALSVIDGHSQEICSNKELFQLACDLVKLPDKFEVADSCVTAVVLIANILSDETDRASEISHDLLFLQGLLDILPIASNDLEGRSAAWSILTRLLVRVKENEMTWSSLKQYVSVLASKSELIEDDLLDHQVDNPSEKQESSSISCTKSDVRTIAIRRIISILNRWTEGDNNVMGGHQANDANIDRLLNCCNKHTEK